MIFTRPQWRSWLVRGAFIIAGYGAVLALHLARALLGEPQCSLGSRSPARRSRLLTAVYTAYLFAQAKARDLWQSPLLPPHLLVQAVLAGAAALLPVARGGAPRRYLPLAGLAPRAPRPSISSWSLGEVTLTHATAHARLAARR